MKSEHLYSLCHLTCSFELNIITIAAAGHCIARVKYELYKTACTDNLHYTLFEEDGLDFFATTDKIISNIITLQNFAKRPDAICLLYTVPV